MGDSLRTCARILVCLMLAVLFPLTALAQFDNGSLVGTIHDQSGGVVPNVAVTATDIATGISTKATTNNNGDYEMPALRVGTYNITAHAANFADAEAQRVQISVGTRQRIDLELKVGQTQTSVEVTGVTLQLETDSSQRGQTITHAQTQALPLVTRNYSDFLALVTGSRQAPTEATTTAVTSLVRQGSYNVNGQRSVFNNFLLDGLDNNAYGESNQGFDNQIIAIPPDSVAEWQVVTNNENAEYGRSSGATINVASESGTNAFHATLYEFLRNTDLNAAGFFKPTQGTVAFKKPGFDRNQFGMNLGGPIKRDRLFYFLDYEGFRQTLKPLYVLTLPTQNELNGILAVPAQDPLIPGTTFAAGTPIPSQYINPISSQIIGYFKQIPGLPISGAAGSGVASDDFSTTSVPFTDNSDKGDLRFDFQQSQNSSWFLRVSDRKETAINYPEIPLPLDGQTNGRQEILDQQAALGYTHLFGSSKVLDARVGISRTKAGKYTLSIGDDVFSIPGLPTNPIVAGGLPSTSVSGGFTAFGRQSTNPQWQDPALLDPKVNYSWVKGKHSMKFGYEYEHIWMAVQDSNPLYGSFTYAGGYSTHTGKTAPDNYWADFLFGTTNNYALATYFIAHLRQTMNNAYAQDDWRVFSNLTLNLGLRWEYGSPYSEEHNYISNFDPATQTLLTITPGTTATSSLTPVSAGGVYGHTLVNPDLDDFGPRLGFAYSLDPRTVARGGFGMSYVHYTRAGSGDILAINAPQALFVSVTQPAPGSAGYRTVNQGFPTGLATTFNPATDNITWVPKNTRDSYVEDYFLSVQRELRKNMILDVAYVGNHGVKLQGFLNGNQINPAANFTRPYANWPSDITEALNEFWSHYDALQVRYEQRSVAGLTLLNSFTWSHSLDNASASLEGNTPSPQNGFDIAADYAQSDYNLPIADVASFVYDLPAGRNRRFLSNSNPVVNALFGGWQISTINTMQAGTPFNLTYTPSSVNAVSPQISATYRGANEYRPDYVPGVPLIKRSKVSPGYIQYVNYAALLLPASGSHLNPFGDLGRNPARTPPYFETDFAFNKTFDTPVQRLKVQFRAEMYNAFNHTNFYLPSSGLGGTLGDAPTSGGTLTSTFEPRILQFALKLNY